MKYTVIREEGETSFGAFVPDLPGCIAVGETREETLALIKDAIEFHLEGHREDGTKIPSPHCTIETVEVESTVG
ncbi:MAG: type II toxin-antitoxin system HicB family antitoxin [Candidatus Omnitrophica bacterium]|nr:type II toxin-antitoxin system HicB family antitoxin [Candidatus Omnitrophota bacterium]